MFLIVYLVFLCSNFLFAKSEETGNIVKIRTDSGFNCTLPESFTFTEEQDVTLVITPTHHINFGWWRLKTEKETRDLYDKLKTEGDKKRKANETLPPTKYKTSVFKSMEGIWEFQFFTLQGLPNYKPNEGVEIIHYGNDTYVQSVCSTNVTIVPLKTTAAAYKSLLNNTIIIACCLGAVLLAIIVAQAAYIVFLRDKAQKLITLNTHNNLSKRSDSVPEDTVRYCSNPGQKMMKAAQSNDDNRDSAIYEAPNIEIPTNPRMPKQIPPQPPALNTMPRTPRADHNMRIGPQGMLASTLNSPARNFNSESQSNTFQRQKQDPANRPPLPLPLQGHPFLLNAPQITPQNNQHDHMFQEVYEEMEPTQDDTYEPPPVIQAMPPRLPMPPKKVPTGNLLDVKDTLKMRQANKPKVTPKPQRPQSNVMAQANELEQAMRRRNDTMPKPTMTPMQQELSMRRRPNDAQTNELEEALRRRNNVKQVPVQSIPDPSSRASPKPKPPPSKPRGPPVIPHPVQEEIYYNENQASSDEEWTYEPLQPINNIQTNELQEALKRRNNAQVATQPMHVPSSMPSPAPKPLPPQQRGPPVMPHPVQEEIYYNENQASSDEEWIYEPLKPLDNYDPNIYNNV